MKSAISSYESTPDVRTIWAECIVCGNVRQIRSIVPEDILFLERRERMCERCQRSTHCRRPRAIPVRLCPACGGRLNRYNEGPFCYPCEGRRSRRSEPVLADPTGEMVNISEIANRFDRAPNSVRSWACEPDFPEPVVTDKKRNLGRLWDWNAVLAWAKAHGRRPVA